MINSIPTTIPAVAPTRTHALAPVGIGTGATFRPWHTSVVSAPAARPASLVSAHTSVPALRAAAAQVVAAAGTDVDNFMNETGNARKLGRPPRGDSR